LLIGVVFFSDLFRFPEPPGLLAVLGLHLVFLHALQRETASSFDGVLWSLAVEVQFYYLFPLLAKAFRRVPWLTAIAMVGLSLLYRIWARHQPPNDFPYWDSLLPGFLDLFAFGMLAAYLLLWTRHRAAAARRLRYAF